MYLLIGRSKLEYCYEIHNVLFTLIKKHPHLNGTFLKMNSIPALHCHYILLNNN